MERKEVIEIVRKLYNESLFLKKDKEAMVTLIPEIKESEDERIRKELINAFKEATDSLYMVLTPLKREAFIAWLEKQGKQNCCSGEVNDEALEKQLQIWFEKGKSQGRDEVIYHPENFGLQKPAEWSEKDESMLNFVKIVLNKHKNDEFFDEFKTTLNDCLTWFRNIKSRVGCEVSCTTKQEWSEEDEKLINSVIELIDNGALDRDEKDYFIEKLKSLIPQSTWKPSKEQIMALRWVLNHIPYNSHKEEINGLLEQLLKLYNYEENN